ncbi:uncharacterized protein LOC120336387 [Styela clava]|uniref:uncharacterized protein LOC120336387 n=1 Tax=Styela clava TaxID=7725 RepID=UPI0019397637|nr:uncharacterized protein LOC120336387 [Styela clava]
MEFLDTSRSAKKYDPQRTARYKRADPRATNVVLGYDNNNNWESITKKTQRSVSEGTNKLGTAVTKDRSMTTARKRGMLSSSLSFGNEKTDYRTESTNYSTHDLHTWGPRTKLQRDSYSWTDKERSKLQTLRVKGNPVSGNTVKFEPYIKLPPIGSGPFIDEVPKISKGHEDVRQHPMNGIRSANMTNGSVRNTANINFGRYYHDN